MVASDVIYPRPLIQTRRGVQHLTGVGVLVNIVAIAVAAPAVSSAARPYLLSLTLFVVLNAVSTFRVLELLRRLELRNDTPDDLMVALFDLAIYMSVLASMAILAALWLATS